MAQEDMEVEIILMFVAGSDTVATTAHTTLFHIISTPRVYHRLRKEILDAVSDGKISNPIKTSEAKGLPYLQVGAQQSMSLVFEADGSNHNRRLYTRGCAFGP